MRKIMNVQRLRIVPWATLVALFLGSCSVGSTQSGVSNYWREEGMLDGMDVGKTTMSDVLDRFGPPSQLVELNDGALLYYLLERTESSGLFLVVYNTQTIRVKYDRAAFLFDKNGVLKNVSISHEEIPREAPPAEEEAAADGS